MRILQLTVLLSFLIAAPAHALILAENGQAKAPIVLSESASEETRAVADELSGYLERITGAEFEIQTNKETARGIFLGTRDDFPNTDFGEALEVRNTFDGVEAFVIRPEGEKLWLVGATEKGASHAAFRFLEKLGCRWFFPAPEWEIVPEIEKLEIDSSIAESDRPKILARRIWYGYGFFDRAEKRCQEDYQAWARHNRMAESFHTYTGHAWQSIIAENQKTFDEHPEYLALVKGERRGPQMCVSSPEVRRIAKEWALKRLRDRPEMDMVSMDPSDGSDHCECEDCQALGNISERAFGLANEVARAVAKEFPGKMVGILAYNDHCEPPSFPLEPNVYVQSTAGFIRGRYTFEELMELWPEKTQNLGFYEYLSVWLWDFDKLPGGKGANVDLIAEKFREYHDLGATSISCESGNNWGPHGRGYYVANKVMWDPKADVDGILADFYEKAFGPAAAVMERYYERFDPGNDPLMSEHLLGLGFRDVDEAAELAQKAGREDVLARLAQLKQYLHYMRLRWELDHTKEEKLKKELTIAALTWCYRTRYSYMNHWAAMNYGWSKKAAKDFEHPSLAWNSKDPTPPWKIEKPVTAEETERVFQEDLERFQPVDVDELEFSGKLVTGGFVTPNEKEPNPTWFRFQRPERFALASQEGEPLRFNITTGVIAWYRDRPEARWTVTDAEGNEIDSGRLPQDGEAHPFEIQVPAPGVYLLEFSDSGAGWTMEAEPGVPVSLVLQRGKRIVGLGQFKPIHVFVPKGTRRLQYFYEGAKHEVRGPGGEVMTEVTESGTFIGIDVPEGTDGKVWSLWRSAPRQLWFLNAPNYIASSPEALIVPEDTKQ